tara:strand:- start:7452 stop:8036 length:585 start_codon:yes stop_codon:yes gene_type:complete
VRALQIIFFTLAVIAGFGFGAYKWQSDLGAVGGEFTLHSKQGLFKLSDFQGKVVILYFGYRYCPDVCPTTLSSLAAMKNALPQEEQNLVKVIFVSVDPKRDSLEILDEYVKFFDKDFLALTGNEKEVALVAKQYGITYKVNSPSNPREPENYTVDHTTQALIIGKDGLLKDTIEHNEPIQMGTTKLRIYIKENI